jgi:putative nucleotidyltransferase with HDIG domain
MGSRHHLRSYGEARVDDDGGVKAVIGASLDVTLQVQADAVLREREQRLRLALDGTVAALGNTVAMRDPYTSSHERRVAELGSVIAQRLGWSAEAAERLRLAALVHDIGKIAVPAEILCKPGRLSGVEFELVKTHAAVGAELLAPIDFDGPVAEIVLQHHERLDGSGYPRGLRGDEVLPGARVLAVADVMEAMITHRPYRPALPLEEALAEVAAGAGSRYDAAVCAAAIRLFQDEGFAFGEQA